MSSRLPGNPQQKLDLLSKVNKDTFPYLMGDILFFIKNHSNVKIVEGTGDGRRDVFSTTPDGSPHITQCKYHNDFGKAISSRETDEIVLALHKFNADSGMFATTGLISPQGKREYLDNFPKFNLDFMEGIDIVDAVLSSPILSKVWFDGSSIIQVKHAIAIPFIIRDAVTDRPLERINTSPIKLKGNSRVTFVKTDISIDFFAPYRSPVTKTLYEHGQSNFVCWHLLYKGEICLHRIEEILDEIVFSFLNQVKAKNAVLISRFGVPFFTPLNDNNFSEKISLRRDFNPVSFVIENESSPVTTQAGASSG